LDFLLKSKKIFPDVLTFSKFNIILNAELKFSSLQNREEVKKFC